jgi:hypothetical protein
MTFRDALQALLDATPADAVVPVPRAWLATLLAPSVSDPEAPALPPPDLSVAEIAARWRRSESHVRALLAGGALPGAYQQHARWLVPVAALLAYEEAARRASLPRAVDRPSRAPAAGESAFEMHLHRRRSA